MSDELPSVLVVEDDENMRDVLRELLELRGFDTRVARTGAEALESARSAGPPAVAIVDIRLPDADGIGLLAELREISGLTEVVVLTGLATVDSAVRALRERSHDYLTKPVDPDRIVE
ncbi:MAG: response regulator, partial [Gemmatimonadota bacterium]